MNQKIYFWFLRTSLLICMLLQIHAIVIAKNNGYSYSNYFLDRAVKGFPAIPNNHKEVFQLISHGKPGYLLLEGKWCNARDITSYLQKKRLLSPAVNHINIYGCAFAKGDEGVKAVEYLSKTLNVTIAASDDITGKDGDWILEVGTPYFALSVNNYLYNLQDFDLDGVPNANDTGYTLVGPDTLGCFVFKPTAPHTDTAKTCIVRCANGLCDTTYVFLAPYLAHPIPDTIRLRPTCGSCTVSACVSTAEVSATGATYNNCSVPAGYTVLSSGGCSVYTPAGSITDTVRTCISICNNGRCDTTVVLIAPPITSLPSDTIVVTFTCDTCASSVCPSLTGLDTTGGVMYSTCGTPAGYTITGPDINSCFTIKSNVLHLDTARSCIVRCANGLCDTSYLILVPFPVPIKADTVWLKPSCGTCPVEACVSTEQVIANNATYNYCATPAGYTVSSSLGCSYYTPSGTVTDTVKTCITICNGGKCDTTVVFIAPPRTSLPSDSIYVTFTCDTCMAVTCPPVDNGMDTTGGITYASCGTPAGYSIVGPNADGCYTIKPTASVDTTQTCVVRCANGLCDTSHLFLMPSTQPLSILVTSFTGRPLQNRTNQLNWAVSNETDMGNYAIERSSDQKTWNNLGTIAALNKGNNPTFQMIDNNPESYSFYRLVLRDAAGAIKFYPKIVHIQRTDALFDEVKIYPNPAKAVINMDYNSITNHAKVMLYVTDIAGRVIKTMEATFHSGNNTLQIDISDLADGSYLIGYHNLDNGNTGKIKFVKNVQ